MQKSPTFSLLEASNWKDYELLDSGDGLKLERFGKFIFSRPESQAMWSRALPTSEWNNVHAVFQPSAEESGGHWDFKKKVDEKWLMSYPLTPTPLPKGEGQLRFWAMTTPGRHLGVFPEVATHWDFMANAIHHRRFAHGEHGENNKKNSPERTSGRCVGSVEIGRAHV